MNIKIGNRTKIKKSHIGHQINSTDQERKSFVERHPIIISFIISMITGFILLFSFWDNVINWIERIF